MEKVTTVVNTKGKWPTWLVDINRNFCWKYLSYLANFCICMIALTQTHVCIWNFHPFVVHGTFIILCFEPLLFQWMLMIHFTWNFQHFVYILINYLLHQFGQFNIPDYMLNWIFALIQHLCMFLSQNFSFYLLLEFLIKEIKIDP